MARGVNGMSVYIDDNDRRVFLNAMWRLAAETGCSILAYCLMGNHFHLAIQVAVNPLHRFMQRLLGTYAKSFNLKYERTGHLFQARYKSVLCLDDAYLTRLINYIELNPVRAGLVTRAGDWAWSSRCTSRDESGTDIFMGDFDAWPREHEPPLMLRTDDTPIPSLESLALETAATNGTTVEIIRGPSRLRTDSYSRKQFILKSLRAGHSLKAISRWLGRAPSSVHHAVYAKAIEKVERLTPL